MRYCLGINHQAVAQAINPKTQPYDLAPLKAELRKLVPALTFDEIVGVPSLAWTDKQLLSHLLARLHFATIDDAKRFRCALNSGMCDAKPSPGYGFSPDPPIFALDAWAPFGPGGGIFGTRDDAERLTGTAGLTNNCGQPITGKGVNVVIVDRGLSRAVVQGTAKRMAARRGVTPSTNQRVLGWTRYERPVAANLEAVRCLYPGDKGSEHAYMIARNVLALAPDATLWDAPLLPADDEPDGPPGPSSACQLFHFIREAVRAGNMTNWDSQTGDWVTVDFKRPVIVVNAWGVMDPESNPDFTHYADEPNNHLVNDMKLMERAGIDVVFAAGNCGEPTPDARCGREEQGPGRGIFGMNGHPSVLTVGAVRTDGVPIALSAQGPGRLARGFSAEKGPWSGEAFHKPDLCAPSHFRESDDAAETNTGTSAACGFAAGVLAALRSADGAGNLKPAWLRALLRETAQPLGNRGWDPRLGYGVINGADALAVIER
jgi:subtilisin family serine protease